MTSAGKPYARGAYAAGTSAAITTPASRSPWGPYARTRYAAGRPASASAAPTPPYAGTATTIIGGRATETDTARAGATRGAYPIQVLADAPLAYYRLNEASGTTLVDSSGNAHGGSYGGGTPTTVPGLLSGDTDTAVSFNGTNTNTLVVDDVWMRVGTVTAEAIIRPTAVGVAAGSHTVVARNGQSGAAFFLRVDSGKLVGAIVPTSGGFKIATGATTLVAGTTYHVAMTYDGVTVRVYLNGVQDGTFAFTGTMQGTVLNSVPLTIGSNGLSTPSEYFAGVIDEVAYYGTALSATRIAAHCAAARTVTYARQILADAPVIYYRLNETSGTTAVDSSGNGNAGTYYNGVTLGSAGLLTGDTDTAATFDGGDDTVFANAAPIIVSQVTVEAVIRSTAANMAKQQVIACRAGFTNSTDSTLYGYWLLVNKGQLEVGGLIGGVVKDTVGGPVLVAGQTYHVAMTYDGTAVRAYLNGVEVITTAATGALAPAGSVPFTVGRDPSFGSLVGLFPFAGVIDEVALYGTALPTSRILAHYQAATGAASSTGTTVTGGKAAEADTARVGAVTKAPVIKVGGRATEADTARAGLATIRRVLLGGRATEGDVARVGATVIGSRTTIGGRVVEVDTARPGAATITRAPVTIVGKCPVETDTARAGSLHSGALSRIAGGKVVETDLARRGQIAASTQTVIRTHRWTLYDPLLAESFEFPLNPNKMTTPHSPRNFHIIATAPSGVLTGGSRQGLGRVVELAREPFEWTFSGRIKTEAHYQQLLRWSTKVTRLRLTDHLGRTWLIRPLAFNPNELIPTQRSPWRYEYDFKVLNYGVVT